MTKSPASQAVASQRPPEQVTLIYRPLDGQHSFSIFEVPGLVVLDHDLERAFNSGLKGAGRLISTVCNQTVEYATDVSFSKFKEKIEQQEGTPNKSHVVTIPSKIHRSEGATA